MLTSVRTEAERSAERIDDLSRRCALAPLFEPGVIVDAHSGQDGDLLPAKSGDTTAGDVR
jgi:hypothetical protein